MNTRSMETDGARSGAWLRFRLALALIAGLVVAGTIGYCLLEGMTVIDGLYMTVITLTTVGFGEVQKLDPAGRMFTIFLILGGVGVGAWAAQNAAEAVMSGQLWGTIGKRRVMNRIEKLDGHYIICGYGRIGRETGMEFQRRGIPFVVIEKKADLTRQLRDQGLLAVEGDATHEKTLSDAGIERARGVVAVVEDDADNMMIILTAKLLNPAISAVGSTLEEEAERKLRRVGADRVVSPYVIGGQRIALALLRPVANEFLNLVLYDEDRRSEMGEISVRDGSPFVGKTIREAELRSRWGAIVIGVKKRNGRLVISPAATDLLETEDIILVVAETAKLRELEKL